MPLFPRTPNLAESDLPTLRQTLKAYFVSTFDRYESLFETLATEAAWYEKAISLRHPLIFYYGHTATFFINKLLLTRLIDQRLDARMESIFAVGVDEMSWDDLNEAHYDWPTPQEVKAYRDRVRELVLGLIETAPLSSPINWENPWWAIIMGIEHERIHLETSAVLITQHRLSNIKPHPAWRPWQEAGVAPENELVEVAAGRVSLGKEKSALTYGWDNEYGRHEAEVAAFKASRYTVSNQEFLAFVEAGGYQTPAFWLEEGQQWLAYTQAKHPTFWRQKEGVWRLRLMTEEVAMPWNWPVVVNYHEAKAFCQWKSAQLNESVRLPTEDEWHRLFEVAGLHNPDESRCQANLHLDYAASPCPVNQFPQGEFFDIVGNVWQWTETSTYPFEGFEVHPIYDDFTTPTFDTQHNIMKGGSWISCGNEAVRESRYAFRRHFFQYAGIRYVLSPQTHQPPSSRYETDKLLSEYAEFHYGSAYFGVPNFPKALVDIVSAHLPENRRKALDIGCASGRASFELARHFEEVTGIDFSARFIGQGVLLAQQESLRYVCVDEGELVEYKSCHLSDFGLADVAHKVAFFQGDACNLKPQLTGYDVVLAANLIDRLYDPRKFLSQIHERMNMGGVLSIASPYTWLEEHTPRTEWLGGYKKDGESWRTHDALMEILAPHFELITAPVEQPLVIRETRRKFQHILSEVSLWRKIRV